MIIKPRKTYTAAFKEAAVQQSLNSPDTVTATAVKLGINPKLLTKWRAHLTSSKHSKKPIPNQGPDRSITELEREVRELRKKLERAELENDILKKAKEFFDKHQG